MKSAILLPVLVIACCLFCGCMETQEAAPATSTATDRGIADITSPYMPGSSTLADAMRELEYYDSRGLIDASNLSIRQVSGFKVGADGSAGTWVLGVQREEGAELLVYTNDEWRSNVWEADLPEGEIDLDRVLSPEALYEQQRDVIGEAMHLRNTTESSLHLEGEIYTVTVASKTDFAVISFNAVTGELISTL